MSGSLAELCALPHPTLQPQETYETLRVCTPKPAKEALRPTVPTAPASPGDRKCNLTDMAVT